MKSRYLFVSFAVFLIFALGISSAFATEIKTPSKEKVKSTISQKIGAASLGKLKVGSQKTNWEYPGYIYFVSHNDGGTYAVTKGKDLYIEAYATDLYEWGYYSVLYGVWDNETNTYADLYGEPDDYVWVDEESHAYIETSDLAVSSGRYEVHAILWDDINKTIEDFESFNLTVKATKSTNAYLKKIAASNGKFTRKFSKYRYSYTLNISKRKSGVKVTAYKSSSKAKVLWSSNKSTWHSGASKTVKVSRGKSKYLYFRVKAESGATKTYKVKVHRNR